MGVLTFLVGANHAVPLEGVQLPLVAEAEVVARPLEHSDLVDNPTWQHDRRADDGGLRRGFIGEPLLEPRVCRLAEQQQTPPGQAPAPARLPPASSHLQCTHHVILNTSKIRQSQVAFKGLVT